MSALLEFRTRALDTILKISTSKKSQPGLQVTNKTPMLAGKPIMTVVIAKIRKNLSLTLSGSSGVVLMSGHSFFCITTCTEIGGQDTTPLTKFLKRK